MLTYLQLGLAGNTQDDVNLQALIFLLIGVATFFVFSIQVSLFGIVGDRVTFRIRLKCYEKILKMPISWFDIPKNNAGNLTARLATDCQKVNGLTTTNIGILFQNISCLITGIVIAFVNEWRITLITLALIPLMMISGMVQMKFTMGFSS